MELIIAAANLIENRYKLSRIRDIVLRDDDVALWQTTDGANCLGVSRQRIDQLGQPAQIS